MTTTPPTRTQAERADQARVRILDAAVRQFSEKGLAGARTEQIAEDAGVNKALLYYYFKSKDALYTAALEWVAAEVQARSMAVFEGPASEGEKFLRSVLNHFDRIHTNRGFQSLMQQEMIRLHRGEDNSLSSLVEKVFKPLMEKMQEVLRAGIASGELIAADPMQIHYAATGANVFFFLSAPLMKMVTGTDPLELSALESRRAKSIELLGQTLFVDRRHGVELAARVLDESPMPKDGGHMPRPAPNELAGKAFGRH
jgi:TetR/AcrR family transcriptional regulator